MSDCRGRLRSSGLGQFMVRRATLTNPANQQPHSNAVLGRPAGNSPHNAHYPAAVRHARDQPSHWQLHEQRASHAQRAQLEGVGAPVGKAGAGDGSRWAGQVCADVGQGCRACAAQQSSGTHQGTQSAPVAAGDAAHNGCDLQLAKGLQPQSVSGGGVQHKPGQGGKGLGGQSVSSCRR